MTDTKPRITLRPMNVDDQAFAFRVFATTRGVQFQVSGIPEPEARQLLELQFQAQQAQYRSRFQDADFDVVLADGTPIGYLYVHRGDERHTLIDVALIPEQTGRGTGTHLVSALIRDAAAAGKPVTAHVEKRNRAWQLWQRLGFQAVGDDGVYLKIERRTKPIS